MELLSSKEDVKLLRCGVRFAPPAVIVTYAASGKTRRRIMPLRNFSKNSVVQHVAAELNSRHKRYLERMPAAQLEKLISMLRDQLGGMSRDEVIAKAQSLEHIDPDEDLNKVIFVFSKTRVYCLKVRLQIFILQHTIPVTGRVENFTDCC